MESALQHAANALRLPEPVIRNFMTLVGSLQISRHLDGDDRPALFASQPIHATARPFSDANPLLNALIDEYDRKL